jgi:hypothetical protein
MDQENLKMRPVQPLGPPLVQPLPGEQLVQFEGFRCMAYLDESGKWKALYGGRELTGFIRVVVM